MIPTKPSEEPSKADNLRQVSTLFHDHIAMIRSQPPPNNIDELAGQWLKSTRVEIMQNIEREYADMVKSSDPSKAPLWAMDPLSPLTILTGSFSRYLEPYSEIFRRQLEKFMDDCGFKATVRRLTTSNRFFVDISFSEEVIARSLRSVIADEKHLVQKGNEESAPSPIAKADTRPEAEEESINCISTGDFSEKKEPRRKKERRKRGKKATRA